MIFDDGGDVIIYIIFGVEVEKDIFVFDNLGNEEEEVFFVIIKKCLE